MKLSIGVPTYNGAALLPRALASLLAQDLGDFCIVISDNGSTDGTPEICRRFAAGDSRVRVLRVENNRGANWNFNRVLEASEGAEFFMWAADDDQWSPDCVSSCVRFLEAHPEVALCGTATMMTDTEGRETGQVDRGYSTLRLGPAARAAAYLRSIQMNSVFYGVWRRSMLAATRLENRIGGDLMLMLEMALAHPAHTLPSIKFFRRVGGTSTSIASLARAMGVKTRWPAPFDRSEAFSGLFETIERSTLLREPERSRLKREVLMGAGRWYLSRLRSPVKVAARLGREILGR